MDIAALFFTLAILVLVAMYLYAPLARRYTRPVTEEEHELSALLAERDRVINALQELDFDFKLGKIPSEDYPTQRANLLQKGADILRKIDALTSEEGSKSYREGADASRAKKSSRRKEKLRDPGSSPALPGTARQGRCAPDVSVAVQNAEERIERAIAARRADASVANTEITDDDLEAMISARRRKHKEKS
ncbi:MAG: hypothetical protein L0287_35140, partial [Anaerolineae bacterium]|nr:hypothetical protein [Anaerolineae bacterium]